MLTILKGFLKNSMMYFYVYLILFSDETYYIGSRSSRKLPEYDNYYGSPVTHKDKWADYDLQKEKVILRDDFKTYEETLAYEKRLIRMNWDNPLCLNENCGGSMSNSASKLGAQAVKDKYSVWVEFTSPDGVCYNHYGIKEFCREHNLDNSHIVKVLKGKRKSHLGWTAKYI